MSREERAPCGKGVYGERKQNFVGEHFWTRGYFVSTVRREETMIREYIRTQEETDLRFSTRQVCGEDNRPPMRRPPGSGGALVSPFSRFDRLTS